MSQLATTTQYQNPLPGNIHNYTHSNQITSKQSILLEKSTHYQKCKLHARKRLDQVCINSSCSDKGLLCNMCVFNSHQQCQTVPYETFIEQVRHQWEQPNITDGFQSYIHKFNNRTEEIQTEYNKVYNQFSLFMDNLKNVQSETILKLKQVIESNTNKTTETMEKLLLKKGGDETQQELVEKLFQVTEISLNKSEDSSSCPNFQMKFKQFQKVKEQIDQAYTKLDSNYQDLMDKFMQISDIMNFSGYTSNFQMNAKNSNMMYSNNTQHSEQGFQNQTIPHNKTFDQQQLNSQNSNNSKQQQLDYQVTQRQDSSINNYSIQDLSQTQNEHENTQKKQQQPITSTLYQELNSCNNTNTINNINNMGYPQNQVNSYYDIALQNQNQQNEQQISNNLKNENYDQQKIQENQEIPNISQISRISQQPCEDYSPNKSSKSIEEYTQQIQTPKQQQEQFNQYISQQSQSNVLNPENIIYERSYEESMKASMPLNQMLSHQNSQNQYENHNSSQNSISNNSHTTTNNINKESHQNLQQSYKSQQHEQQQQYQQYSQKSSQSQYQSQQQTPKKQVNFQDEQQFQKYVYNTYQPKHNIDTATPTNNSNNNNNQVNRSFDTYQSQQQTNLQRSSQQYSFLNINQNQLYQQLNEQGFKGRDIKQNVFNISNIFNDMVQDKKSQSIIPIVSENLPQSQNVKEINSLIDLQSIQKVNINFLKIKLHRQDQQCINQGLDTFFDIFCHSLSQIQLSYGLQLKLSDFEMNDKFLTQVGQTLKNHADINNLKILALNIDKGRYSSQNLTNFFQIFENFNQLETLCISMSETVYEHNCQPEKQLIQVLKGMQNLSKFSLACKKPENFELQQQLFQQIRNWQTCEIKYFDN